MGGAPEPRERHRTPLLAKPREHGCSLSLGVVKKNDACMCSLDAPKDKLELLIGRHPTPIARPYVCPKNYNPPLLKIVEQGSRGDETWKSKERSDRISIQLAVQRAVSANKSTVDLGFGSI